MDRPPVAFEIVTPPATEPVSLAEAKAQCRITSSDEDLSLTGLIQTARELVEIRSERALITQTRRLWIDNFPRGMCNENAVPSWYQLNSGQILYLPWKPISSVTAVEYVDPAGTWQTVDPASYVTDIVSAPGRLQPTYGLIWPVNRIQVNAIKVTFVCGAATAPAIAKQAILLLVGHWFENREAVGKVPDEIAIGFESLLNALRWH